MNTILKNIKSNHLAMTSLFKSVKAGNAYVWANGGKPTLWIKDNYVVSVDSNDSSLQDKGFTKCLEINFGDTFNMEKLRSLLS